jgi:hypothetical protein
VNIELAKANLDASVKEEGFDWIVEVERGDDYTVRMWNKSKKFVRRNVSRGVLEDEWSPFRDRLIQAARQELEAS